MVDSFPSFTAVVLLLPSPPPSPLIPLDPLDSQLENVLLAHDGQTAWLCDFGFTKHVPSIRTDDLRGDPTTCYQSPERELACYSPLPRAEQAHSNAKGGRGTTAALFDRNMFSVGMTLFLFVAYHTILARLIPEDANGGAVEADESILPALNVFQPSAGGGYVRVAPDGSSNGTGSGAAVGVLGGLRITYVLVSAGVIGWAIAS